ncbi:MAG: hypothetical protein ACTSRW_14160 [Candidatus Helarchaeota archaeon]
MSTVKLTRKELLEKLQARLTLLNGKKISQQEILDKCIEFSVEHIEEFIREKIIHNALTPEKIALILSNAIDCPIYFQEKSNEELLHGK